MTGHNPTDDAAWLGPRQFKIHRLPPTKLSDIRKRQELLRRFLEERAPCVYLPNYDFDMACVTPALSQAIQVALIMHCDDPVYYDFAARHGGLFNAIVCVSDFLAKKLTAAQPPLEGSRHLHSLRRRSPRGIARAGKVARQTVESSLLWPDLLSSEARPRFGTNHQPMPCEEPAGQISNRGHRTG